MKFPPMPSLDTSTHRTSSCSTLFPAQAQDMFTAGYTQDVIEDALTVSCPWESTKILLFRQVITAMQTLEARMDTLHKEISQTLNTLVYHVLFTLWPAAEKIWGKEHIKHWIEQEWSTQDFVTLTLHIHPHWVPSVAPFVQKHRPQWCVKADPDLSYGDLRLTTPHGGKERLQHQILHRLSHLLHIEQEPTP